MPSVVSWLVAGLAVADRAASLSYTLSKTYDASNFLDEFEFQTAKRSYIPKLTRLLKSAIDLGPGFSAPSMNYQNKADALDKGLVSVQNGKIYLGVDSEKPSGWGQRPTVRVLSKNSFNQGLVITKFTHLPEPVCGGSPFLWEEPLAIMAEFLTDGN
ncbi:Endo-1,3(4)-beta-glucanase [Beauveria bassiana]|nr:Endo-1,3(4)-beta-glucanase [Beauveria bassiana]